MLTSIYALLLGGGPFWATYLPLKLKFPLGPFHHHPDVFWRLSVAGGGHRVIIRERSVQLFLLSLVIGFSAGFHYQLANRFKLDWEIHKNLFLAIGLARSAHPTGNHLVNCKYPPGILLPITH